MLTVIAHLLFRWAWAQAHNVQLPDEYDSIHHRIEPFAAIPRRLLQERARQLRDDPAFWMREMGFTVNLQPGAKASAFGPGLNVNPRPQEILRFVEGIEHLFPVEVNLTMTFHDTPWSVPVDMRLVRTGRLGREADAGL